MSQQKQPAVIFDQAVLGGISDSPYMGKPKSLASIVGFNLHKVPGLMLVNQKMNQHSPVSGPTIVDDLVKILQCSDGIIRLFGKTTGKIWEIDENGNYTQPAVIPTISTGRHPTVITNDTSIGSVAGAIMTISLAAAGSGYVVGNVLAIGGVGTGGTATVLTVDGSGAILTLSLTADGSGYAVASGVATTGGAGIGATINVLTVNNMDWVNPNNALADDGIFATFQTGNGNTSHYLKTTGYGFAIPSNAVITGVIVEIKEYRTQDDTTNSTSYAQGGTVKLVKGGTILGNNYGQGGLSSTPAYYPIGGAQDFWGITLTPADVNDPTFGVAISRSGLNSICHLDTVRIRVCYTVNGKGTGVFDAMEYEGPNNFTYVYYALPSFLGRYRIGDAITDRLDNYASFYNEDPVAHPMIIQNLVLYIGDGNVVAQVDASGERTLPQVPTAFSPQALAIQFDERVTALSKQTSNLLVGSKNINNLNTCHVYNWDTYSKSFNQQDPIMENGVNAFMPDKLRVIISAGENGNFYEYVRSFYGQYLQPLEQIPPAFPTLFNPSNKGVLYHTAVDSLQSIPIFGFSRTIGNPALQGIYTLGGRDSTYPVILTLEYPISTNSLQNITIWSLCVIGNDIYSSWMDETDPNNIKHGVDKLDWNNKVTTASFETMVLKYTKTLMDRYRDFVVGYDQLPAGTSIDFYYNRNKEGYVKFNTADDPSEFISDKSTDGETDRHMYKATKTIQGRTIQFKVVVNSHNNDAPNIEDMTVLLDE